MLKFVLISLAVLCAVIAAGLVWGWGFWFFDEPTWRRHALGWLALSAGSFAASCHPAAYAIDRALDGRWDRR